MTSSEGQAVQPRDEQAAQQETIPDKFARSYDELLQALYEAWNSEEDARQSQEAAEEMHLAMQRFAAPDQVVERAQAYAEYLRKMRDVCGSSKKQDRIDTAFHRYVASLAGLWSQVDERVRPEALSIIGQSIAWAGYYASFRVIAETNGG